MKKRIRKMRRKFRQPLITVAVIAAVLTLVQLMSVFVHNLSPVDLYVLGIRPRDWSSAGGVLTSPLVHSGFGHLFANLVPLSGLALVMMLEGGKRFLLVTVLLALGGGVAVWAFGAHDVVYLGSSGLVFGYLGYINTRGATGREPLWMTIGVAVAIVYLGVVASLLAGNPHVSWLGAVASLGVGILAALKLPMVKAAPRRGAAAAGGKRPRPQVRPGSGHGLD